MEWLKKTSFLSDRKVKRKNQVFEYHISSPKGNNEEDIRSINDKLSNPVRVLGKKIKRSIKYDW